MEDPIKREGLRDRFWENVPLKNLSPKEWEALCDGCGRCCLNKLEDEETGEVALTRVACRLFDDATCRCSSYDDRKKHVPECISLTPRSIEKHAYWLPDTCAYKLIWAGRTLYDWHPLISGDPETVASAGISVSGITVSEYEVAEDDWEDYIIEDIA